MSEKHGLPAVVIRCDAGPQTGFGHLMRSSALASYLRDSFDCRIFCRNGEPSAEGYVDRIITESGATRLRPGLPADASMQAWNEAFIRFLSKDTVAVLDNYYFDTAYMERVRRASRALAVVDDMPTRQFACDVFFTPSPREKSDFDFVYDTEFYGGVDRAFLREPFLKPANTRTGHDIRRIVVALGGADPFRLTDMIAEIASQLIPGVETDVIAGPSAEVRTPEGDKFRVHRRVDADMIARLLDEADFGIMPASTSSVEAMARRLPTAVGWYVDNQVHFYRKGVENGWFAALGNLRDNPEKIKERLGKILKSYAPESVPDFDFASKRIETVSIFRRLWNRQR